MFSIVERARLGVDRFDRSHHALLVSHVRPARLLVVESDGADLRETATVLYNMQRPPVVLQAATLSEAKTSLVDAVVDVVITNLFLPDSGGIGTIRALRSVAQGTPIVVLKDEQQPTEAECIGEGADDCVHKRDRGRDLVRAVEFAMRRGTYRWRSETIEWELFRPISRPMDRNGPVFSFVQEAAELFTIFCRTAQHETIQRKLACLCERAVKENINPESVLELLGHQRFEESQGRHRVPQFMLLLMTTLASAYRSEVALEIEEP